MDAFNVQNILDGQAIGVSLTGMSIVFSGLLLISIYIALLPNILNFLSNIGRKKKAVQSGPDAAPMEKGAVTEEEVVADNESESYDIASVIGLVLQLEHERLVTTDNEQITITRNINQPSMWGSAGKMRKMPQRRTHA